MAAPNLPHWFNAAQAGTITLGPARVITCDGSDVIVERWGQELRAHLALGFGYAPQVDDELLVISDDAKHFVVGLVRAQGEIRFDFAGDVTLSADHLELTAEEGMRVRSPHISLASRDLHIVADRLQETSRRLYREVKGLFSSWSGEKQEVVAGEHATRAERASVSAREVVTLNGQEIHIG